jgi:hypothetical protein
LGFLLVIDGTWRRQHEGVSRIIGCSAQDFLRACERIEQSLSNHKALDEGDELLRQILSNCAEHYQFDTSQEGPAEAVQPDEV